MEHAKLPFMKSYQVIIFHNLFKERYFCFRTSTSAKSYRYESIWPMVHKIRIAMGLENDLTKLEGMIEFDDGYFEVSTPQKKLKRGRGSKKTSKQSIDRFI